MTKTPKQIPRPTTKEIEIYLQEWETLDKYKFQESSLKKLFTKTYPLNDDIDNVLIKVCSLNDFYSTRIRNPFKVAGHIVSLKIDDRLKTDDLLVVNEIAKVKMNDTKEINFYSFATKYCSHHKPTIYPIYDYYVERMLTHFKKLDKFQRFRKQDFRNYKSFREILLNFKTYYKLDTFDLKQIDKYLWLAGKKYFKREL